MWPPHVGWYSSKYGGWDPNTRVSRKEVPGDSCISFCVLASHVRQHLFFCTLCAGWSQRLTYIRKIRLSVLKEEKCQGSEILGLETWLWTFLENKVGHGDFFFSFSFHFFMFHLCFLIVSKENSKYHRETTLLVNSSDILVICCESAYCILMTFLPRIILVGLPAVCSDIGILEFKLEDKRK